MPADSRCEDRSLKKAQVNLGTFCGIFHTRHRRWPGKGSTVQRKRSHVAPGSLKISFASGPMKINKKGDARGACEVWRGTRYYLHLFPSDGVQSYWSPTYHVSVWSYKFFGAISSCRGVTLRELGIFQWSLSGSFTGAIRPNCCSRLSDPSDTEPIPGAKMKLICWAAVKFQKNLRP